MHGHLYECTLSFTIGRLAYKDYKEYKDPSPRQPSSSWLPEFRHNSEFKATLLIISTYMIYEKRDLIGLYSIQDIRPLGLGASWP